MCAAKTHIYHVSPPPPRAVSGSVTSFHCRTAQQNKTEAKNDSNRGIYKRLIGSAPGFLSVLCHWFKFTQREGERGNIGEYRYLYFANLAGEGVKETI